MADRADIHPKVQASALAGAITVVLVFVVNQFGIDVPPAVASSVTLILMAGAGYAKSASGD